MCDVRTWGCLLSFNTWRVRVDSSMCESHMRYKNFEYPRRQNYFPARCSWPHFTFIPETPSKGLQAERENTFMNTFSTKTFLFLSPRYFCHSSDSDPKFIRSVFLLFLFLSQGHSKICYNLLQQCAMPAPRPACSDRCWMFRSTPRHLFYTMYLYLFNYML